MCQLYHNKTTTTTQPQLYSHEIMRKLLIPPRPSFLSPEWCLLGRRWWAGIKQNHYRVLNLRRPNALLVIESPSVKCNVDYFQNLVSDQFN